MSKTEARRITVVDELQASHITNAQAAQLLGLSVRQIQRLKAEATANGTMAVLHKSKGRKPVNAMKPEVVDVIVETYTTRLQGYNFCHAADVLAEEHGVFTSVSTLSRYLKASGIRSPKAKRRPKKHRCRDSRTREGELAQMDASKHDWLSNGSYLYLHGAVDDATGRILALHFDREETFECYCELMLQMNRLACLPREIYTDARSVFVCTRRRNLQLSLAEELAGIKDRPSQFARALRDVGILLIIAGSPQAKGGIERLWGTLQDRLPKDMKRRGITTLDQANAFLKQYIPYYNRKFAVQAAEPVKAFLAKQDDAFLEITFSKHEVRCLDSGLSFSFNGCKYRLPLFCDGIRVPASSHDTLTVVSSSRAEMKVLFKGMVLVPEKLALLPKAMPAAKPIPLKQPVEQRPNSRSPWRQHNYLFTSKARLHDIFADELSP